MAVFGGRRAAGQGPRAWPPALARGRGTARSTLETRDFLVTPESVQTAARQEGAAAFTVAAAPPRVDLAYHQNLGPDAVNRRLWSSWGDIGVAGDGRVYCGIGDHANDVGGDARCFLYRWGPRGRALEQVVDMNRVVPPQAGQPAWSKVHARIDEGADGKIYFSCTLNDGNRAVQPAYRWTDRLPGGQLYRYDPQARSDGGGGGPAAAAAARRPRCWTASATSGGATWRAAATPCGG